MRRQGDGRVRTLLRLRLQLDFIRKDHHDGVAVAEGECQLLARCAGTVADTYEFHVHTVPLGHSCDHVRNEGTVQPVLRTVFLLIARTCKRQNAILLHHRDGRINLLGEFALGALHLDIGTLHRNRHSGRTRDGGFAYTRHGFLALDLSKQCTPLLRRCAWRALLCPS